MRPRRTSLVLWWGDILGPFWHNLEEARFLSAAVNIGLVKTHSDVASKETTRGRPTENKDITKKKVAQALQVCSGLLLYIQEHKKAAVPPHLLTVHGNESLYCPIT